jgi:single-stranded-DNA-specific exonuclease
MLLTAGSRPLHLAGPLRLDTWNGSATVQLVIDDAAWPG